MNGNTPLDTSPPPQAAQFVNKKLLERDPEEKELFDVIVLSNNSPESGVRVINSAKQHGRCPRHKIVKPFSFHFFHSL